MTVLTLPNAVTSRARRTADDAQVAAGVEIRPAGTPEDCTQIATLLSQVWKTAPRDLVGADMLRALTYSGSFVVGAYAGRALVAASVAFPSLVNDRIALHSHVTGVRPQWNARGVGYALKVHQRAWALERDIRLVRWTFDPLVQRNAYVNLMKLRARAVEYLPNFYGTMADGLNVGDDSDRLTAEWDLASDEVSRSLDEPPRPRTAWKPAAQPVLEADELGLPCVLSSTAPTISCQVPTDIVAMRVDDPFSAQLWRRALRSTMQSALRSGYRIEGLSSKGAYVLTTQVSEPGA